MNKGPSDRIGQKKKKKKKTSSWSHQREKRTRQLGG